MPLTAIPKVSCITVFYNRGDLLDRSVDSLIDQTLQDLEIIVIDDGSTDETMTKLKGKSDPRLKTVFQANIGFTASMNRAIRASKGRYIAVHGAGDISHPDRLALQASYLDANPEVGAVGCRRSDNGRLTISNGHVRRGSMLAIMLESNPFSHGEVMFRRSLFDKVGGYREAFRFAQDRDLWLRMGRYCDYAVLPQTLYFREYISGSVTKTPQSLYLQTRLSSFAVQCAKTIDSSGQDLFDALGPSAFFLSPVERSLAHKYTLFGLRAIRDHEPEAAHIFLTAAFREHFSLYTLVGKIALSASRIPKINHAVRRILQIFTPRPL